MSKNISDNLINFKKIISGDLPFMKSTLSTLTTKINASNEVANSVKKNVSSLYFSENKSVILGKFDQLIELQDEIIASLENNLKTIIVKCNVLLEKITRLEVLVKEIADAESVISSSGLHRTYNADMSDKAEVDAYNAALENKINAAKKTLEIKNPQFDYLHQEALTDLNILTSMDSSLKISSADVVSPPSLPEGFEGGEMVKQHYTASNGVKVSYYVYMPKSRSTGKIPVHIYLHGDGESGSGVLNTSLPKLLNEDSLNPNAIIICPQGSNDKNDRSYQWKSKNYRDALIELTNKLASENNGDTNKISLSGHSRGAIMGYQIASENPGYFSAFVPVSGYSKGLESGVDNLSNLNDVKIWGFHGTNDSATEYEKALHVMTQLGDNMQMHVFEGAGHSIQNDTYSGKFEYNGVLYSPLEWAIAQERKS